MYQPDILTEEEGRMLLDIARKTMEKFVRHEVVSKPRGYHGKFDMPYGVVCALTKGGNIRSRFIVGLPYPLVSLIDGCMTAVISACDVPDKVTADELAEIKIELSILTEPSLIDARRPEDYYAAMIPHADGFMLRYGIYESFLMPDIWNETDDKKKILDRLCIDAGLSKGVWKEYNAGIYRFQVQVIKEE